MTGGHGHPLNPLFESWKSSWIIVFHQPRLLSILSCVRMVYNHHQDMRWRLSVLHWFWITSPAFIMTTNVPQPGWQLNERHEQQRRRVWVIFSSDSSLCFVSAGLKKMVFCGRSCLGFCSYFLVFTSQWKWAGCGWAIHPHSHQQILNKCPQAHL